MNKVDIYINDQRLDIFQDEEITINLSVQNIQDISKVFTDFTQGFTVPASPINNAIFSHYYRTDISGSFDGRLRQQARIEINSLPFRTGVVEIENVQLKGTEPYAYTITFYGDVVNMTDLFGEDYLYDLDFSAYDHEYTDDAIFDRFTTEYDSSFFYPMMSPVKNWYYNSDSGDKNDSNLHFKGTNEKHGIHYYELKPALKATAILDAIEAKYGITFTGSFLSSNPFVDLSLWLHRREGYMYENQPQAMAWEKIVADVDNAPVNDIYQFSDDEFEPTISDVYNFSFSAAISGFTDDWEFAIIDTDGDVVISQVTLNGSVSGAGVAANLVAGRSYYFAIRPTTTATAPPLDYQFTDIIASRSGIVGLYIDIEQTSSRVYGNIGNVFVSEQMPEIKVKDFLAGILKMYNMVIVPSSPTSFLLQPLDDWYAAGTAQDYQTYFDITEYAVNRPSLYREIEFKYQDTEQILGYQYQRQNNTGFGDLRNVFQFDGDDFIVELPFECPLFERLSNLDTEAAPLTNVLVYKSITSEANEDGTFNPYLGAPVVFYASYGDYFIDSNSVAFVNSDNNTSREVTSCWYANTSNLPTSAAASFSVCFGADIDPYHLASVNRSLYNTEWSNYITDLYNAKRRIFQVDAILPIGKIITLDLKNGIIWNNNKYIVNNVKVNMTTGKATFELLNVV
jgi:hypothetical protein